MALSKQHGLDGAAVGWSSTVMTGTAKVTGEWIELSDDCTEASWQTTHTGTATGSYIVEVSNDPAADASKVASLHPSGDTVVAAVSAAGTQLVRASNLVARWARLAYTNATNTGTLGACNAITKRA